jgi:DNA-binding MarR family transcriptional regulator
MSCNVIPVPRRPSTLARELRQRRPFRSDAQVAVLGVVRTADHLGRALAGVVEPTGVTLQQFNVLRILRGAGDAGLPTLEIAERMVEQTPGVTRLLDRLEAKGFVRRERCPRDRRQVLCFITSEGLALLATLDAPVLACEETLMAGLTVDERHALIALLDRVRGAGADEDA